jgi:hypothetical protein
MTSQDRSPDDLQVPFIFVPHGDPEPTEWMARHPGWINIPATFVPYGSSPPRRNRALPPRHCCQPRRRGYPPRNKKSQFSLENRNDGLPDGAKTNAQRARQAAILAGPAVPKILSEGIANGNSQIQAA